MKNVRKLISYLPNRMGEIRQGIWHLADISRELSFLRFEQLEDTRRQLEFLRNETDTVPRIGYDMRWTAARLKIESHIVDLKRPTICSMAIGSGYQKLVELCFESRIKYCEKHGYNYLHLFNLPLHFTRPPVWVKIPFVFQALQLGCDRMFFLDADAMITNTSIRLEPFFERLENSGKHMLIAEGTTGLNAGAFFMRATPQSKVLLDLTWKNEAFIHANLMEQAALQYLLHRHSLDEIFLVTENSREFNSFPPQGPHEAIFRDKLYNPDILRWEPGDFIIHLTSYRGEKLRQGSEEYAARVI